jgi:hypothetical protein
MLFVEAAVAFGYIIRSFNRLSSHLSICMCRSRTNQGYLSFWNDNISYTLRGCILIELALRGRITMTRDPNRRRYPLSDRQVEVLDDRLTGEVLLDEALKMMKTSEKMSVGNWIDLMSGRKWQNSFILSAGLHFASPPFPPFSLSLSRRDMERNEDRLPAATSAGTPCKRIS